MRYEDWEAGVLPQIKKEDMWKFFGYRKALFLRIAMGSARESKGWYYRAKELLSPAVIEHRLDLLGEVIALLVTELNAARPSTRSAAPDL
jgi:hypothetical protein